MTNRDRLQNAIRSSAEAMIYPEHEDVEFLATKLSRLHPECGVPVSEIARKLSEAVDAEATRQGMRAN
jgi:hypothetical protein